MPEQQTEPDQQQTYRNNEQNRINNRHAGSTTDMPQQPADILRQPTESPDQQANFTQQTAE
jgi:hypothetical protein